MVSIRSIREFHGAPISLGALARLERREFPLKMSDLVQVAIQPFSGHISVGDVEISWTATFASNGSWSLSAHIVDTGTLAGDYYVLDFLLSASRQVGQRMSGQIERGNSLDLNQSGIDPWVRNNWGVIIDQGVTVRLNVTPDVAGVIGAVTIGLLAAGIVVFFASPGKVKGEPCPEGFEENKPCYRFRKVENEPGTMPDGSEVGTTSFIIVPG